MSEGLSNERKNDEDVIKTLSDMEGVAEAVDHGYIAMSVKTLGLVLKKIEEQEERIAIMEERPTGVWLDSAGKEVYVGEDGNVEGRYGGLNCSYCGEWLTGSDEYSCGGRYCPSCGVSMRKG